MGARRPSMRANAASIVRWAPARTQNGRFIGRVSEETDLECIVEERARKHSSRVFKREDGFEFAPSLNRITGQPSFRWPPRAPVGPHLIRFTEHCTRRYA